MTRAITVDDVLREHGVDESEAEFAALLSDALAHAPRPDATALPRSEEAFLARHSGVSPAEARAAGGPRAAAVAQAGVAVGLLARSTTVAELAQAWGVDGSRVRHRVRDGALYSVRSGRALRLPAWQFDADQRPLPGLAIVLAALPAGLHPREVEGFMTTPQSELVVDDEPAAPRDWLLHGGDPHAVAAVAADLDRW